MGRSVVFVDLPQLIKCEYMVDFLELFKNLRERFDEVRAYIKTPSKDNEKSCNIVFVLAKAGAMPIVCPSDPDPIIACEICRFAEYEEYETIAIVSGDNGYFMALEVAKKKGKKVTVILPPDCQSKLLNHIADDVQYLEYYAPCTLKEDRLNEILERFA